MNDKKQDNLFLSSEAREKLMSGVRKVAQAVGKTMGTYGSNSLIECLEHPFSYDTNDGFTIVDSIKLGDPIEQMGRNVLAEAINRANKQSGDGSSTTCVLTHAILEEGMKHLDRVSPMDVKKSLDRLIPIIEKQLKKQSRKIDVKDVKYVASISAEDEEIGEKVQEIYEQIGKDGIVQWDTSKTPEDSYQIGTGITIPGATYITSYMLEPGQREIRMSNVPIILIRRKLTSAIEFENLFPEMVRQGDRQILIFVDDVDTQVIADLLQTQRVQGFRSVIIKMPVLWGDEWWEDLSEASGAKIIDSNSGIDLPRANPEILGRFGNVTIRKDETVIEGTKDLTTHIANILTEGTDNSKLRASRLNTRTARYFVGAHSERALAYRRLKVEDAINAAACALENGIVAGGGSALWEISENLPSKEIGATILKEALKYPFKWIARNASLNENISLRRNHAYDSKTGKVRNMFKAKIVDPTDVTINAVKNAIGVAASILTVGTVVTLPKEDEVKNTL